MFSSSSCLMVVSYDHVCKRCRSSRPPHLSMMVRRNQREAAAGTAPSPRIRRHITSRRSTVYHEAWLAPS
ncbi:hypothetical protein KCU93_g318, partial [Aureobasidium melanogenum]